ncbi:MAG: hypothetical protein ACREJC_20030, partial [Tepidisphaeraceae bacterium]
LVAIPEGVILNYLSRRVNPTPHLNFTPPALIMFNEQRMLADFRAHPPDVVCLVASDTWEYGARHFGQDYGRDLMAWVQENYGSPQQFGATPFKGDGRFGIVLMHRKAPAKRPNLTPGGIGQ